MTDGIDVSIIIPTFNRLWCLPRSVDSCRGTKCHVEIIVVDDGSSDGTWEWLQQQPGVTPYRQVNRGQTWAVNRGISLAHGRYFRFLDSDDYLCPGTIDRQFEAGESTGVDVVYSRVDDLYEPSGRVVQHDDPPLWDDFTAIMLGEGYSSHFLGMMFRRNIVEMVPRRPDFALREDRMFMMEVALQNPTTAVVPGNAGYWVHHDQQMHDSYRGMKSVVANWQFLNMYKTVLKQLEDRNELTPRRAHAATNILWRLAHQIAYSHPREAADVADWVYQLVPDFQPPEGGMLGRMYRQLGFRGTQQVLRARRAVMSRLRRGS